MDSEESNHHVLPCYLCKTAVPTFHCDICQMRICTTCVGEHLSDESKEHKAVPIKMQGSTVLCHNHSTKSCELHCEQCDSPICARCISSGKHEHHKKFDIWKKMENKKADIHNFLQELEESILPKYETTASHITDQKANLEKNSRKLKSDVDKHGDEWHKAIDTVIQKYKTDIDEINKRNETILNKHKDEINHKILEIKQSILDHKRRIDSFDFYFVSLYKSRNAKFRSLPSQTKSSLPSFTPRQIDRVYIKQHFGLLSPLPTIQSGNDVFMNCLGTLSSLPDRQFVDEPQIITDLETDFCEENRLRMVCCLTDEKIWTCGNDNIIRLYNLKGELLRDIQTYS